MKRRGRADDALAAVTDRGFQKRLADAITARGGKQTTGKDIRLLALPLLPAGALDGVQASFRWDAARRRVEVLVRGASVGVDEQVEARG